jgi:hypothetical protein
MTIRVEIFCQDEAHRRPGEDGAPRRSEIVTFVQDDESGVWLDVVGERASTIHARSRPVAPGQRVLGEQFKLVDQYPGGMRPGPDFRRRWDLQCELCRRRVVVRDENLQPLLEKLGVAGVSEIALHALASRVRKQ